MPSLLSTGGSLQGTVFELSANELLLGRDHDCGVVLPDASGISRRHARFFKDEGAWRVEDAGSTYGTLLNGAPLLKATSLVEGDVVEVGPERFTFHESTPAGAQGAATNAKASNISSAKEGADALGIPKIELDAKIQEVIAHMSGLTDAIRSEIGKVIVGQVDIVMDMLTAIVSRGHVLLIGLPGLAKTTLIRTISEVLDLEFRRIQFTPDLMPSDITGTDILEVDDVTGKKEYRFIKGPIFTQILLADEINRTPPKTQAALLEAMQEYSVTASGKTFELAAPFFVLATQNPLEQEGTYPLPEAQLDRFMFSIYVDYPSEEEEEQIAKFTTSTVKAVLQKVMNGPQILQLQKAVRDLPVSDHVLKYSVRLVRATRPGDKRAPDFIKKWIHCGAGPRAAQNIIVAAKARAVIAGRLMVTAEDVRSVARPVLRHRMFTNFTADSEGMDTDKIVNKLLEAVPEPDASDY
jgi:MoxR-like ATPase